jgi:hypothetical protein
VSINKPLINSIELGKEANQKLERYERVQTNQAESGSRITKELLYEYFARLIKFFNEPKVASHQDSYEMQEIMEKISNLMQKECLKFDEESDDERGAR